MTFIIVKNATTWWPVRWNVPVDGGGVTEVGFDMRFKRLGIAAFTALLEKEVDDSFLTEIATDWRGIADDAGRAVAFDADGRAAMLDVAFVPMAIAAAWQNCFAAAVETRQGNSEPSPADGPAKATEQTPATPG